jgi:hypothetical protein
MHLLSKHFPFFQLRITIWSLVDRSVRHINLPKDAEPGLDFSPGGSYLAVAERRNAKDFVAIYSCESWTEVTVISFPCYTFFIIGFIKFD